MTGAEIIAAFELQVDDLTELSSTQELSVLEKVYQKLASIRPWQILKKTHTATQSTSVPYIALPSDFVSLSENANHTDRSYYGERPVVYVGANYDPYEVVSWADRRTVRQDTNKCYIDIVNSRLYFTAQPTTAQSVEFDYNSFPAALTTGTSPVFPARFHPMFQHGMAVEDFILQLSDKAKSYAPENQALWQGYVEDLEAWDASLVQM